MNSDLKIENRPSNFDRRALCLGSGQAEAEGPPREETPPMKRGSDLHAVVFALWLGSVDAAKVFAADLSDDDFLAATEWVGWLRNELPEGVALEVPVDFNFLGIDHEGHADFAAVDEEGYLFVGDLKTGRGPWRKPRDAWQLRLYAIGLAHTNDDLARAAEKGIRMAYFTPEDPFDTVWREDQATFQDLVAWEAEGKMIAQETKKEGAPLNPDPADDVCGRCSAASVCLAIRRTPVNSVALKEEGLEKFRTTDLSVTDFLKAATPEVRTEFWSGIALAKKFVKSAEEVAVSVAGSEPFANLELRPSKVDKRWIEKDDAKLRKVLSELAKKHSVTTTKTSKTKAISPAAALLLFPPVGEAGVKKLYEEVPAKDTLKKPKK